MELTTGIKHSVSVTVDKTNCAGSMKSGALDVFATPSMIALMEQAAAELCEKYLDGGSTTVGTLINVSHLAASVPGMTITAEAVVTAVDGRKISFGVTASDNAGIIGRGAHERFVVYSERFVQKAQERAKAAKEA